MGNFASLEEKLKQVRSWPGVSQDALDAACVAADYDGTMLGYGRHESRDPHLDIVVTVHRETLLATMLYLRERIQEVFGTAAEGRYGEWELMYQHLTQEDQVQLIPGAQPFIPNSVKIEVVDFGANQDYWGEGFVTQTLQDKYPEQAAGFSVLCNAAQNPYWVRRMDGRYRPYAMAGGIHLFRTTMPNTPFSPCIRGMGHMGRQVELDAHEIECRFVFESFPLTQSYDADGRLKEEVEADEKRKME